MAEQSVAAAQQQFEEDAQRADLGAMTPLDVLSAESQLASSRVQLVNARTRLQQQEVSLKALISKTSDPALDAAVIEPTDNLPGPSDVEIPSLSASMAVALTGRSAIHQAQLALQNQHIAEQNTRKNLLPTFSVYAAVNLYGLAPETNPALRQLVQWTYPRYSVGLTWSLPGVQPCRPGRRHTRAP